MSPLTIEDFNLFASPRKLCRTLQQQSSSESSSVKGHASKQCENDKLDTSSDEDSSEADGLTSNHTNYEPSKRMQGKLTVSLKGGALQTVQRTESMSSTFFSHICMDEIPEPQLANVMRVHSLERSAGQRDASLKAKSLTVILRSIFAVLFFSALLMIVKHLQTRGTPSLGSNIEDCMKIFGQILCISRFKVCLVSVSVQFVRTHCTLLMFFSSLMRGQ